MNSKILIGVVVVLLLGFGGYFLIANRASTSPQKMETFEETPQDSQTGTGGGNLKNLFRSGISQTCTFESKSDGYQTTGTVYMADGKMRGDFDSLVNGQKQNSHILVADEISYVWTDGQTQGYKMAFGEEEKEEAEKQAESLRKSGLDLDANLDYNCSPQVANSSMFELPSDITFVSIDEMMKKVMENNTSACAACNSLSGEQKNQCLVALKCN